MGQINLFGGSDYAMRVWLRPDRIAKLGLTVPDIVNAVNQQNQISPAGQIGGPPVVPGTEYTYTVRTQGCLLDEEVGNIVVRSIRDGSQVVLKDVARLELGTQLTNAVGRHNGGAPAVIAVFQIPGTNALEVANRIKATMEGLSQRFPQDMEYTISLDTTIPVEEGINEIVHTLFETDATVWSLTAGIFQPIFQGGRIRRNYEARVAQFEQGMAQYQKAALNAYRESANALVTIEKLEAVRVEQEKGVAALKDAAILSRDRYDTGLSNYLEILIADQSLFQQERLLAQTRGAQLVALVDLYRALGGGWQSEETAPPAEGAGEP